MKKINLFSSILISIFLTSIDIFPSLVFAKEIEPKKAINNQDIIKSNNQDFLEQD